MRVRALFVLAAVVAVGPGGTVSPAATVHAAPVLTNPVIFVKQTPPGLGISVPGNPYADGTMFGCTGNAVPTHDLNFETFSLPNR